MIRSHTNKSFLHDGSLRKLYTKHRQKRPECGDHEWWRTLVLYGTLTVGGHRRTMTPPESAGHTIAQPYSSLPLLPAGATSTSRVVPSPPESLNRPPVMLSGLCCKLTPTPVSIVQRQTGVTEGVLYNVSCGKCYFCVLRLHSIECTLDYHRQRRQNSRSTQENLKRCWKWPVSAASILLALS